MEFNKEQYLEKLVKRPKVNSERADLIKFFVERLRDKKGKKYLPRFIGYKVAHLEVKDLYYLKSVCEKSDNLGKTFWGSLKINGTNRTSKSS